MARIGDEKLKDFLKWYFSFDVKDVWNWVLLVIAIILLWWGIKTIMASFSVTP